MMRILHTLDHFISVTENWIYPQITQVPGVEGCVICSVVENLDVFPIDRRNLTVHPPAWNYALGVPRLFSAISRRLAREDLALALKARMQRPSILHAHFGMRGWASLALKRRLRLPLATSFYGWDAWLAPQQDPIWRRRYRDLFAAGDLFLVEGPAMRERLASLGCAQEKIFVHRIGVDLSRLPFSAKDFTSGLKIAMVGRFIEKKGLLDGMQACARASARGVNLSVAVIGDPLSGDVAGAQIKKDLHALANGPELSGRVRFTGFLPVEQTRSLLAQHNVLLCPSKRAANGDAEGGSPVVLTEAMALGLLCIGTRHCDIPEVIRDNQTGFLRREGDVAAMADLLCELERRADQLQSLTLAGREHVEESFSLPAQLARLRAIYHSLLNGRR